MDIRKVRKVEILSEENLPRQEKAPAEKSSLDLLLELLRSAFYILVIAFMVRYFLVQPFVVEGSSMEPNFTNQEYLLVNKLTYRISEAERGDVIVFRPVESPYLNFIKRVIGLPGEAVEIKQGKVWIDGKELEEKYLSRDVKTWLGNNKKKTLRIKLEDDEYFVLGDNREFSKDSREIGTVPKTNIIGPAWISIFPFDKMGIIKSD